jgi:hypothetical protein
MQQDSSGIEIERLVAGESDAIDRAEDMLAEHLANHPQWAELLLPFLASGRAAIVGNARRLLCLFDDEALLTIARGFEADDPTARFQILGILWAHIIAKPPRDREYWIEAVAPYLRPGLADKRRPERFFADPERLELEHDYRVCDETYLFINRLLDPAFDDSEFRVRDEEGRRAIVEQFDRRFANLLGSPGAAARKAARSPAALAEITIVASFPNAFATPDTQLERDRAAAGQWAPAQRDFMAVAAVDTPEPGKAIFEVKSFMEMLSAILFVDPTKPDKSNFRPLQSVKRVNIISHGNPGLIAMSGTVDQNGGVLLRTRAPGADDLSGPLDVAAVQAASNPNLLLGNGKPLAQSLRDRFAPGAEIYLLACKTGMGGAVLLMQDMKGLFKATIQAFSKEIAYCPTLNANVILDRAFTAVGDCNSGSTRGFKHLKPDKTV